jgi:anhydro-N-acetylmuramic acid kinase
MNARAPGAAPCLAGLMSGTSADGVDGVLVVFADTPRPQVLAHVHRAFPAPLRTELVALNHPGLDELHRAAQAGTALAEVYAEVVEALLAQAGVEAGDVQALGAHGQTIRHQPAPRANAWGADTHRLTSPWPGYTRQILDAAWLAERTRIDVVCDFRSADVASGGQGAPLVPAAHDAWFAQDDRDVAVLNLGGMANLSLLPRRGHPARPPVLGFDCGPGNVLMDLWCSRHRGEAFDADGAWAAQGQVRPDLLTRMLAEPFFQLPPPKSTGRERFDGAWLTQWLAPDATRWPAGDVQATLAELTALTAAQALQRHAPSTVELLVCGGGALNSHVMRRLAHHLPGVRVSTTADHGLPVDQIEALAFAWLAKAFLEGMPGNLPSVTGARRPRRLGAFYPAT